MARFSEFISWDFGVSLLLSTVHSTVILLPVNESEEARFVFNNHSVT